MKIDVVCSDNIPHLKTLPDNSLDSIVTDCPYGLGVPPDPMIVLKDWIDHGYSEIKQKGGFMNNEWDTFVPQPIFWKEVYRVLKPGGHVLAFFGTRTYDWGVMAIRVAGFEVRDQIQWIYGSGFPKSLDVSKSIDKHFGAKREVIGITSSPNGKVGGYTGERYKQKRQTKFGVVQDQPDRTAPATDEAKQWDGWGTALKPANEPVCLARKPLEKGLTIAENVIKWGTGGLNIEACRIGLNGEKQPSGSAKRVFSKNGFNTDNTKYGDNTTTPQSGRFPANVIFDEESSKVLDEQSGVLKSGSMDSIKKAESHGIYGKYNSIHTTAQGDIGYASRFFYCAKASRSERNGGMETEMLNIHPTVKPIKLMRYLVKLVTPNGGTVCDPFAGSGTTGLACELEGFNCLLIDNNQEYVDIITARIAEVQKMDKSIQLELF